MNGVTDTKEMMRLLAAPFAPDKVKWRIGSCTKDSSKLWAQLLCYIDARDAYDRLDAVVGPENWQNHQIIETATQRVIQGVSIRINGEWITKWDGAGATATEGEKGGISDAFKRACVLWGIGRYLYGAGTTWAECSDKKTAATPNKQYIKNGNFTLWWGVPANAMAALGYDKNAPAESSQEGTDSGSNGRSYPERAPSLPKEDRVPAELVDFLSPLLSVSDPALVDQAIDVLYRDHSRKAWGKGQEMPKVRAWLVARKAVILADDEAEVRGAYKKMLETMGYDAKANTADMPATHGQLVQWMVTVCSDRLMEIKRAAA